MELKQQSEVAKEGAPGGAGAHAAFDEALKADGNLAKVPHDALLAALPPPITPLNSSIGTVTTSTSLAVKSF